MTMERKNQSYSLTKHDSTGCFSSVPRRWPDCNHQRGSSSSCRLYMFILITINIKNKLENLPKWSYQHVLAGGTSKYIKCLSFSTFRKSVHPYLQKSHAIILSIWSHVWEHGDYFQLKRWYIFPVLSVIDWWTSLPPMYGPRFLCRVMFNLLLRNSPLAYFSFKWSCPSVEF